MAHSPYFTNVPPGLYRLAAGQGAGQHGPPLAGFMDVFSEFAATRAELHLRPRTSGRPTPIRSFPSISCSARPAIACSGCIPRAISRSPPTSSRSSLLARLEDKQLLELYPGSEGTIPGEVQPRRNTYPSPGC